MSNRLRKETSPYLLQHADNPVDWFPWCEEAFCKGTGRRQTHIFEHWLQHLPLVPRYGT